MRSVRPTGRYSLTVMLLIVVSAWSQPAMAAPPSAEEGANKLGSPIMNFCVVTSDVLWRGSRPDQGGAAWLIEQGAKTIVNLELIHDDRTTLGQAAVGQANQCTVDYFHLRDWEPLPAVSARVVDNQVAHFLAIVTQQPKPVYVHCRAGMNRTGLMVAAYRVVIEGVDREQAIREMRRFRGQWAKADAKYIRGLTPERRERIRHKVAQCLPNLHTDAQVVCANGACAVSDR